MYKRTVYFVVLVFFTVTSYAAENSLEDLQTQVTAAHNKIATLKRENEVLRQELAGKEKEVAAYRATLEKLEAQITDLKEGK